MTGGLALLTTGGTIAMQWAPGRGADLAAPPGPALTAALPGLDIRHEAVFAKPSAGITLDDIRTLAALAERHAAAGTPVVITHGTDTLEETAFALELFARAAAPIVLTGAMRAAGRPGADGEANLIAACRVAMAPDARRAASRSASATPHSPSTSSVCWPAWAGGRWIDASVREKRGAGAGWTTPSRSTKVERATLWG